jgi:hypothetical protein
MFCPKCAAPVADDLRFCPRCAAPIGLVARVLAGEAVSPDDPEVDVYVGRRFKRFRSSYAPSPAVALVYLVCGLGALVTAATYALHSALGAPPPRFAWLWPLWLGVMFMIWGAREVGRYRAAREMRHRLGGVKGADALASAPAAPSLAAADTARGLPTGRALDVTSPPSVTEDTTRRLEV